MCVTYIECACVKEKERGSKRKRGGKRERKNVNVLG